ncbi:glycosyltransferase family 4 protein [Acaryochloris sp. IP29b_bin.137]|uniref:glycosyltransferase family 4 protein n=1 Tax=Acaryochloris sp. IP29b_bin.137 TaxID=2969217 RepID=UPI002638DBBE|nr:glycosyltransferase family 4 protein [Acaryochloris sp. IP29b_bin.137]
MKIAVIGPKGLPAKQGGIEHNGAEIYSRMVSQGHSVDLFARSSYINSNWFDRYEWEGVQVIALPTLRLRGIDAFFSSALGAIAACRSRYDIVHFHALGPSLFSWIPRLLSYFTNAKVVVTCHGLDWRRAKWGRLSSTLIRLGESAAVRFAHSIIVVSQDLEYYFVKKYGRPTVYIPNAPAKYADSDTSFSYGASLGLTPNKYVLFLGRLVPEKRPDLLLRAFTSLNLKGWKLVLVGGTSDTNAFMSQLWSMAAEREDIVFTGELRGRRLAEIVRGAGLFTLPSDLEGLPLVMLEAMREGRPILASNIPAHQQLLGQERGVLFKAGDLNALIRCLEWAVRNPQDLADRAKRAQHHVRVHYDWDIIATKTINLYNHLLHPVLAQAETSGTPKSLVSQNQK